MHGCYLILFFVALVTNALAQYSGGSGDGFSIASTSNMNPLPNIYLGGNSDGVSIASASTMNPLPNIYRGGNNDGVSISTIINQNPLPAIYSGGSSDGFSFSFVTNQRCSTDTVVWNGNDDKQWHNFRNWNCGALPAINSVVIIPAGRPNNPIVYTSYEIKKLFLMPGSSIMIQPAVQFKLNGQ